MNDATKNEVDVIVIGAGFSGVYATHRLTNMGFNVRGIEAGGDVGGTWYWNRYPGARCDVESLEYSYGFDDDIQQQWNWSHRYAEQPEIRAYIDHVATRFDVKSLFAFNTRVVSQSYDDVTATWTVNTDKGDKLRARFIVMATGNLTTPRFPDIPGREDFAGAIYHSSRWPEEGVDFTGKRVALIGTGATGIQITPKVAAHADQLYVLQRTPNFSVPAQNRPLDEAALSEHRADYPERRERAKWTSFGLSNVPVATRAAMDLSAEEVEEVLEGLWQKGGSVNFLGAFNDLMVSEDGNERAASFVRNKIRSIVKDPEVAELLAPKDHPIGSKRLCVDTDYFETYNRDNVRLVDIRSAPIRKITAKGIETETETLDVDAIIFATGFDAMTGALSEIAIAGRDGLRLSDKWKDGPRTYLGLMVQGFPNMFLVTGPGSPSVKSNMVLSIEQHVDLISDTIAHLTDTGARTIEPTAEAEEIWVAHVNDVADATLFPKANSWYTGANIPGKPRVFMPYVGGVNAYRRKCDEVVSNGYEGFVLGEGVIDGVDRHVAE